MEMILASLIVIFGSMVVGSICGSIILFRDNLNQSHLNKELLKRLEDLESKADWAHSKLSEVPVDKISNEELIARMQKTGLLEPMLADPYGQVM